MLTVHEPWHLHLKPNKEFGALPRQVPITREGGRYPDALILEEDREGVDVAASPTTTKGGLEWESGQNESKDRGDQT